jgi:hypothetical protein
VEEEGKAPLMEVSLYLKGRLFCSTIDNYAA